jgi:hypothetical protein
MIAFIVASVPHVLGHQHHYDYDADDQWNPNKYPKERYEASFAFGLFAGLLLEFLGR